MGSALNAGVSGLQAHQQMLDVAGNNLANVNTTAFKSSRINFSELLGQTIRQATAPSDDMGGMNPVQAGSGVEVASTDRNMNQGSLVNTGQPLDMAIEGEGFFVLSGNGEEVYSRVGTFSVDAQYYLVDPATGYRVQRIGSEGVEDGFQVSGNQNIRIPYDVALPAQPTTRITCVGNLKADDETPSTLSIRSGLDYSYTASGNVIDDSVLLASLDQSTITTNGSVLITGTDTAGSAVSTHLDVNAATTTVASLLAAIETAFNNEIDCSLVNGEIVATATSAGYSMLDFNLAYSGGAGDTIDFPTYFQYESAGGEAKKDVSVELYDTMGIAHAVTGSFIKTKTDNQWDFVINSVTGNVQQLVDRRVRGINFQTDGTYGGVDTTIGDNENVSMIFGNIGSVATFAMDFGTVGKTNGLTQFGSPSTASVIKQDGYASGSLSSLSVSNEGVITGLFSNGVRRDVGTVKLAVFQNPAGLESVGNNYYQSTGNSGDPKTTRALTGGAGSIRGSSLENSNVDVASEFVNLIQAQNGFQANARTIKVANDLLRELTQLIR